MPFLNISIYERMLSNEFLLINLPHSEGFIAQQWLCLQESARSERVHKCSENRDVAAAQVVLQRGYTAVGHIAVNFGEGKLHE